MMTNELLREKSRSQKSLDDEANHDLNRYVENNRTSMKAIEDQYAVRFIYGRPRSRPKATQGTDHER
ncbi:MAG: hypothetical protein ACLFQ1_04950 [Halochromatium sp.]